MSFFIEININRLFFVIPSTCDGMSSCWKLPFYCRHCQQYWQSIRENINELNKTGDLYVTGDCFEDANIFEK